VNAQPGAADVAAPVSLLFAMLLYEETAYSE
jgi:hypothetical protein